MFNGQLDNGFSHVLKLANVLIWADLSGIRAIRQGFAVVFQCAGCGLVSEFEQAGEVGLVVKTAAVNNVRHAAFGLLLQTLVSGL